VVQVLVFGRTGQLATGLARVPWPQGWQARFMDRAAVDLSRPEAVRAAVLEARPSLVVNAAAYTAVDKAESEAQTAHAVNALAPEAMAQASAQLGIPFITISTDYVFDGSKAGAYGEADPVSPLGVYGASKEEGERRVRLAHDAHLILRTSWVYSAWGANFVRTMLRLGAERPVLRVVADQQGKPTSALDLAEALVKAASLLVAGPEAAGQKKAYGTYHVANDVTTSWHGFATEIFRGAAARGGRVPERLEVITTADYPTLAKRPANSALATEKFETAFSLRLRPWRPALGEVLDELLPENLKSGTRSA
jgi:dTDP-4-dehydrorhamnose reductase